MSRFSPADRISLTKLAQELGVSASTVWRWTIRGIRGRRLPCVHIGGRRFVTREAFAKWIEETQIEPQAAQLAPPVSNRRRESQIASAERTAAALGVA